MPLLKDTARFFFPQKGEVIFTQKGMESYREKIRRLLTKTYLPERFGKKETDLLELTYSPTLGKLIMGFLGWSFPQKEQSYLWAIGKIPFKLAINITRLVTEILPTGCKKAFSVTSNILEMEMSVEPRNKDNNNGLTWPKFLLGFIAYYGFLRPGYLLSQLLCFTGKAATSPLENMRDAWHWRGAKEWCNQGGIKKALGYLGRFVWAATSVAVTTAIYSVASYYILSSIPALGGAIIKLLAPVLEPAANFLASVFPFVTPHILSLGLVGSALGVTVPILGNIKRALIKCSTARKNGEMLEEDNSSPNTDSRILRETTDFRIQTRLKENSLANPITQPNAENVKKENKEKVKVIPFIDPEKEKELTDMLTYTQNGLRPGFFTRLLMRFGCFAAASEEPSSLFKPENGSVYNGY